MPHGGFLFVVKREYIGINLSPPASGTPDEATWHHLTHQMKPCGMHVKTDKVFMRK